MVTFPIVNINGTSKDELIRRLLDAKNVGVRFVTFLHEAMPHARDYQLNPDDYLKARDEHIARIDKVREIVQELYDIAINIDDQ